MCTGGGDGTLLYIAPPTLYSHAHKGFSVSFVDFYIDRSRISHKSHAHKATPTNVPLLGTQKANPRSIDEKSTRLDR